jgi:hypothetical protein
VPAVGQLQRTKPRKLVIGFDRLAQQAFLLPGVEQEIVSVGRVFAECCGQRPAPFVVVQLAEGFLRLAQ